MPTDVWAMGITLYCYIYGDFPFEQTTRMMVLYNRILTFQLQFPTNRENGEISADLKDFFTRILEKEPPSRITIAEMKVRILFIAH
jgi:[calcium/calmodulin-dependent protein kinase] kinase